MEQVIYKYPLELTDLQRINLPEEYFGKVLAVQEQKGQLIAWVLIWRVGNSKPKTHIHIAIVGTGNPPPADIVTEYAYLSTMQMAEGRLVWHVFYQVVNEMPRITEFYEDSSSRLG